MRAAGMHIGLLSTGISNYYRKLGWERAGRQRTFTFDRSSVPYLPEGAGLDVSEDWQQHVDALSALHNTDGTGAARDPARFELLALRKARRVFVGRRGGVVVAYAAVGGAAVREYAGAAPDVAGLLRRLFPIIEAPPAHSTDRAGGQSGQYEMTVQTPAAGHLPELLLDTGVPASVGYQGMIKILDAPGLFGALGIEVEVEGHGDVWSLRLGERTLEVTDGELVKLVFGPERRYGVALDLFPVEFYQWPMDPV